MKEGIVGVLFLQTRTTFSVVDRTKIIIYFKFSVRIKMAKLIVLHPLSINNWNTVYYYVAKVYSSYYCIASGTKINNLRSTLFCHTKLHFLTFITIIFDRKLNKCMTWQSGRAWWEARGYRWSIQLRLSFSMPLTVIKQYTVQYIQYVTMLFSS